MVELPQGFPAREITTMKSAEREPIYFAKVNSLVGELTIAASAQGLVALHFDDGKLPGVFNGKKMQWIESPEKVAPYAAELEEYFAGKRRGFSMPLDLRGTDFQKRCWKALLNIPYGETKSYADIARAVGSPRAFRAVGMANHYNPVAIVVPCHRVIASDGTLGGYGGGLACKETLLRLERDASN